MRQRTALVNALRAHLAEFGVIAPLGLRNVARLIAVVRDESDARLPALARQVLRVLAEQVEQLAAAVAALEQQLMAWHKSNPVSQRLASIPGIGPIIATALAATVVEASGFRSGREFAAWLGLVPRQHSTGGKARLGGISKRGNRYLRRLLINGASANLLRSKATNADPWVIGLRRRRPSLVVIESNLIDAEGVGHFLVGATKERKPSAEFSEFRTIQGGCTPADTFGDLSAAMRPRALAESSAIRAATSWRLRRRYAFREAAARASAYPAARYASAPFLPLAISWANRSWRSLRRAGIVGTQHIGPIASP